MVRTRIKICGITRAIDALAAVNVGADAIGFVFWSKSPRCIAIEPAAAICCVLPPEFNAIGVFVSPKPNDVRRAIETIGLTAVQLCGPVDSTEWTTFEPSVRVIRSITVDELNKAGEVEAFEDLMLDSQSADSPGGTGQTFDWTRIPKLPASKRLWLAGGLTTENVGRAIATVRPYAVDVSSGVEDRPGIKSHEKIAQFVAAVRAADVKLPMNKA